MSPLAKRRSKRVPRQYKSSTGSLPIRLVKADQQLKTQLETPGYSKNRKRMSYSLRSNERQTIPDRTLCRKGNPRATRREKYPEEFPNLDFHHSFGSFLTQKSPVIEAIESQIARYWQYLSQSPTLVQLHIHEIGDRYRDAFRKFFTADPISLHGHVSDASSPALVASLVSHLISHAAKTGRAPALERPSRGSTRVAVIEGYYGAGFGPLAYDAVMDIARPVANGPRPIIIKTFNANNIDIQIRAAKSFGCVALFAEIVRARDGRALSESLWKNILKACEKHGMILVVDEAMTSIRCGAPFAHQLPQYCKAGFPDLILFGKAVRTNGIAIDWRGINIKKLGILKEEDRLFTNLDWQERVTEMAPAADLLTSWGTLVLAQREQWPQRARRIGQILRGVIIADGIKESHIGGLHSLVYLRSQDSARFSFPVMGAKAGKYIRWLPTMDSVMMSEDHLRSKIFGPSSIAYRKAIWTYLKSKNLHLGFCSGCGNPIDEEVSSCERCVVRKCEECEIGEHVCPLAALQ
ncbi:MAG: hypothetical protein Q9171_002255 [Xanthocarpia ochracea]